MIRNQNLLAKCRSLCRHIFYSITWSTISFVGISLSDIEYAGKVAVVTGWGRVNETGNISPILAQVEVPIYTNEACQKTKYGKQAITENMMCAGYDHGELDACQGDSGGPLHLEGKDRKIDLIGMTLISYYSISSYPLKMLLRSVTM